MFSYLARRVLIMIPTLLVISFLIFIIIQLPPGDYLSNKMAELQSQGDQAALDKIAFMRAQYGLDRPFIEQYLVWLGAWPGANGFEGMLQGYMGHSFEYDMPVSEVVGERLWLTIVVSVATIIFTYVVSFPIGVYSAVRQYSVGDHVLTFIGFLGLATPNFLLALVLLYLGNRYLGTEIGGLMDERYIGQPWTWGKFGSIIEHLLVPTIVIGTSGTAGMIRRLRANLLDELQKQYVVTGRAKGLSPGRLLMKYPLRMSLNPFIADIGNILPHIISGAAIVSVVLSLPTTGPMLLQALEAQDQFLAGSFLMQLAALTVIGMFLSDLALAALDPRIRLGAGGTR
ncbi:MAG: ABC transporter permease [Alphaproteobacteria bacterium]|nr:ABC transporter permease [Alphaproteobacteria bacterium]